MTCIVGLVEDGTVYIGADSAGVANGDISAIKQSKVFRVGEFLIGYTDSFRLGQLLQYALKPPQQEGGMGVHEYMCTAFTDEVRRTLKDGGWSTIKENEEIGGLFLIGYRGRLFAIESRFPVIEKTANYTAIGCGHAYAKGAMFLINNETEKTPQDRIRLALMAAVHHNSGVVGPFHILSTP